MQHSREVQCKRLGVLAPDLVRNIESLQLFLNKEETIEKIKSDRTNISNIDAVIGWGECKKSISLAVSIGKPYVALRPGPLQFPILIGSETPIAGLVFGDTDEIGSAPALTEETLEEAKEIVSILENHPQCVTWHGPLAKTNDTDRSFADPPFDIAEIAALGIESPRYINPATGLRCEAIDVVRIALAKRRHSELFGGKLHIINIRREKKAGLKPLLKTATNNLLFEKTPMRAIEKAKLNGGKLIGWTSRIDRSVLRQTKEEDLNFLHLEDGFVRSRGLGVNLVPPLSLIVDTLGPYYDCDHPSDLEVMLERGEFDLGLLNRATRLIEKLKAHQITKYNVDNENSFSVPDAKNTRILVPGQVEDDASIKFGSPEISTNLELLKAVRNENPNAVIIYKPHPDVLTEKRPGQIAERDLEEHCDLVASQCDAIQAIQSVDAVHTMTSTLGFEALLRGVEVHTYGGPFYAGWGLTSDRMTFPRRTRLRSLSELVAAVLIEYPIYQAPNGMPCQVEDIISLLISGYSYPLEHVRPLYRPLYRRFTAQKNAHSPRTKGLSALYASTR